MGVRSSVEERTERVDAESTIGESDPMMSKAMEAYRPTMKRDIMAAL
jgi:hypothetical protein